MKLQVVIFLFAIDSACGQTSYTVRTYSKRELRNRIDSLEEVFEGSSHFLFQSGFANKVIYAGRNFGVDQNGATFGTSYHHRSGFTLDYEGNYWSGMQNKYALTQVGGYFEKSISESLYLSAGYWRLFFHTGDDEERKMFANFFMLNGSWYTPACLLDVSYFFVKGNENAHRLDVNLSKSVDFYHFLGADKFSIEPTVAATFATTNYLVFLSSLEDVVEENLNAFRIGNYEFILPFTYRKLGKYELNASWHYAWPVPINAEEEVHPVSYYTLQVSRTLLLNKSSK